MGEGSALEKTLPAEADLYVALDMERRFLTKLVTRMTGCVKVCSPY